MTGALALAVLAAALAYAATCVRRRLFAPLTGGEAILATAVIAIAGLVAELELLGALGAFSRWPILAVGLAMALASAVVCGPAAVFGTTAGTIRPALVPSLLALALAALAAAWMGPTLLSLRYGIHQFDSIWYHLPWAADFAQSHSTVTINYGDVEYLTAFYPATAEMIHGLGVAFLGSDVLSPLINLGWLSLTLLAAWCLGARRGVGPAALLGAAAALATPMVITSQPGTADNDITAVAFVTCAAALLSLEDNRLVLAGIAAGLAFGTKLTAVPAVAVLAVLVVVAAPRGRRVWVGLRFWIPFLIAGGYWYLRNLVAIGTPFPWVHIPGLPQPAKPLQSGTAFSVAHYLAKGRSPGVHVWHALDLNLGTGWPALLVALVAVPVALVLIRPSRELTILALVALGASLAYVFTPQTAPGPAGHPIGFVDNVRYLTPTLVLTLVLAATLRRGIVVPAVLAVLLALDLARADQWANGGGRELVAVVVAIAVVVVVVLARRAPLGVIAAGLLLAVVLAHPLETRYLRTRYTVRPHISSLSPVWLAFRSITHARVAVSGTYGNFFTYPLDGLQDTNTVRYLGMRGSHGSFTPIRSCATWIRTLNAGHYDYLVNTPDRDIWAPARLLATPSAGWLIPGDTAQLVYRRSVTGQPVTVWHLSGPVSLRGCGS